MALVVAIPPAWADETLTVCDGTTTNSYVPYASDIALSTSSKFTSQMIYLPANLSGLPVGATIKAITFHGYLSIPSKIYDRRFFAYMGETELTAVTEATLNNRSLVSNQVFGGDYGTTPSNSGTELTFTFTNGYTWNGGNLAIELYCASTSNSSDQSFNWYGVSAPAASSGFHRVNNKNANQNYLQAFLPKMTITYEGGSVVTNPAIEIAPESLTINDAAAGTFTITGTDITGSINASLANTADWTLNPETLSNTGGTTSVAYTGRALSASNTVTASAANDGSVTASATVNYLADLYIVTDNGVQNQWDFNNGTPMAYDNGTYTANFTASADNTFILFARKLGESNPWNTRLVFGPNSNGDWVWGSNTSGTIDVNDDDPIQLPAGIYTITIDATTGAFTITKYVQPDYAVTVSPDGGTINFGDVQYGQSSRTTTITVTNDGVQPVTPTLSALTAPYSTDYVPTELASGESMTINITFTPTEEGNATATATLSFGNGIADRTFNLTGKGIKYGENDHSAMYDMTYDWVDDNNNTHTSNLLETATDPNQIIAMLRKIYVTPEIPGNKVRGYTEAGAPESLTINGNNAFAVNYSAVGQLNSSREYTDTYGWDIPTQKSILSRTAGSSTYYYMDPTEYEPNEEGITLIMIEMKDGANPSGETEYYSFGSSGKSLRDKIGDNFKSARIITTYKKSGTGEEAGTLFKIDADKLNRFFFLAKGQLRIIDHGQAYESDWTNSKVQPYPSLKGSTFTDNTFNSSSGGAVLAPFEHMFEEFSPNQANSSTSAMTDVYQELVNMASYEVVHDCVSIPFVGGNHEFNMYGIDSESADCQDVRDMMFFVPDYRMKFWKASAYAFGDQARDPSSAEKFVNYNQDHRPTLGLYVIRQNEITGEQKNDNAYELHLSWESNLLDFLPSDEGQYFLYRVIIDGDGNRSYEPVVQVDENGDTVLVNGQPVVVTLDPNTTTYTDYIAMQQNGQQVTYVVQGQDQTQFLSLQMSNEESYIIPGTDKSEIFGLSPKFDHYSRFDPETEANYYANQLKVTNNVGTNVKSAYLGNGAVFTFYRSEDNGESWLPIATATSDGNGRLTIAMQNQNREGQYNRNGKDWIKMNNPSRVNYSADASGNVTFSDFNLYDNFCASVLGNNHPGTYLYKVELTASTTIDGTDSNIAHSNQVGVLIHKTAMDIEGYTASQIDEDVNHSLPYNFRNVDVDVKYSSKTEILRYDNYRWAQDEAKEILDFETSAFDPATGDVDEEDMPPTGIAGNQATFYSIAMNNNYTSSVNIAQSETKKALFVDNVVTTLGAGLYDYAPVVETFTSRSDYNTYGAPVQQTAVSTIGAEVGDYTINLLGYNPVWEDGGNKYCHYTVKLKLTPVNVPEGYDLYKVRAWRKVDRNLLNEQQFENHPELDRDYRLTDNGEYMMEEVGYNTFDKSTTPQEYQLGQSDIEQGEPSNLEVRATFGAQKLREKAEETGVIESLPMSFIVRAYYTRVANLNDNAMGNRAPRRDAAANAAADGKYYIAESTCDFTFYANDVNEHTGLNNVLVDKQVTGVAYYNVIGQKSDTPFDGMNIVVTSYSDGTTSTTKVIK